MFAIVRYEPTISQEEALARSTVGPFSTKEQATAWGREAYPEAVRLNENEVWIDYSHDPVFQVVPAVSPVL